MSAHRRARASRHLVRRTFTAVVVALATGAGFLAAAGSAQAATTWFVKPALSGGNNALACTSSATACATITGVLAKSTFANGDTINVAPGTYTDHPVFTKGATVLGAGSASTTIDNLNTANTSAVAVTGAVTVNLSGLTLTHGLNNSTFGGGLRVGGGGNIAANVTTSDVVITSNKATLGAGVVVYAGATYTANTGTVISANVASGTNSAGGGIYNAGTTNLNAGSSITGNTAPLGGGVVNGLNLTANGASITGNTGSTQGGGVYTNSANTQLNTTTITGNSSPLGAGVYVAGGTANLGTAAAGSGGTLGNNTSTNVGGGAYVAAGTLNLNNATVQNNTATNGGGAIGNAAAANVTSSTVSGNTSVFGGAVYSTGTVTVASSTLSGNQGLSGGAAYNGGTLNVTGSTLTGNSTTGAVGSQQGGAITSTGPLTLTGSTVSNNTTGNQGGAISSSGAVTLANTAVTGNTAGGAGGGLVTTKTLNVTGGSISGNTAVNAGALYNLGTGTIDGTTISNNTANGGTTSNGGNAGAIDNVAVLNISNATMTGNKVVANTATTPGITGYGGAILSLTVSATVNPVVTLTNTSINGGAVSGGNAVIGGAIAVYPNTISGGTTSQIIGNGLTLSKNVAAAAGGIFSGGVVTLTGSTLDQNQATHTSAGDGAAIYAGGAASALTLDSTAVTHNTAAVAGAGLFLVAGGTAEIRNGSSINGNTAASGGAIYSAEQVTVKDSHVDGNTASFAGGGFYAGGNTTLTNTTVDNNSAAAFGGGILTAGGTFNATGGEVDGNTSFGGGGVIVGANSPANFDGTNFVGNTVTGSSSGGGAILSAGALSVKNATISGNSADAASGYGGAIYSGSQDANVNTSLKIDSSTLTGNSAYGASAVIAGSSGSGDTNKTAITNTTISGNDSASAIGALQLYQGSSITGSTITDNTAGGAANANVGGIVSASGVVSLSGSILSGNTGHQCYQALADGGYNLLDPNDSNCGLSAAKHDVFAGAQLAPLAANGGPTQTRLPSATSPALDQIPATSATGVTDGITGAALTLCDTGATDQRGTARPQGAKCDIGAVEKEQTVPTVTGPANADYSVGNAGTPLTYTSTGSPQPTLSAAGLPSGVTLHDNGDGTGTISGTPAAGTGGSYTVTVTAANEAGHGSTLLTLVVHQAPVIGGPATATYTVGQPGGPTVFSQTTGFPLGTFSSSGTLPGGVNFDGSTAGQGTYSGTPVAGSGGVYNLTVKDSNGTPPDATAPFTLTVDEAPGLSGPGTATLQVGTAGATGEFVGSGFPVPALTSTALPGGLSLTSTGSGRAKIAGTPANGTGGVYGIDVTASNGVGSPASAHLSLTVNEAPELAGPTAARFVVGSPNAIGFSSDGYPQATVTESGALPAGLTFTADGAGGGSISGTATGPIGSYPVTITASNGINPDAVVHLTIDVVPPLSITSTSLPNVAYKTAYSGQVMATGGQPAYTFSIVSGSLPAGLAMNSAGLVTGSTTANPGSYSFTVKATDAAHPAQSATKVISIVVVKGNTSLKTAPIFLTLSSNGDVKINIDLFEADLKGGFPLTPIAGAPIVFKSGTTTVCTANTDANGHVKCQPTLLNALLAASKGNVTASYAGNTTWNPSTGSAGLVGN